MNHFNNMTSKDLKLIYLMLLCLFPLLAFSKVKVKKENIYIKNGEIINETSSFIRFKEKGNLLVLEQPYYQGKKNIKQRTIFYYPSLESRDTIREMKNNSVFFKNISYPYDDNSIITTLVKSNFAVPDSVVTMVGNKVEMRQYFNYTKNELLLKNIIFSDTEEVTLREMLKIDANSIEIKAQQNITQDRVDVFLFNLNGFSGLINSYKNFSIDTVLFANDSFIDTTLFTDYSQVDTLFLTDDSQIDTTYHFIEYTGRLPKVQLTKFSSENDKMLEHKIFSYEEKRLKKVITQSSAINMKSKYLNHTMIKEYIRKKDGVLKKVVKTTYINYTRFFPTRE